MSPSLVQISTDPTHAASFPHAAQALLHNSQLRKNVAHATDVIQAKRDRLIAEKSDWQQLRTSAAAIRGHGLEHMATYLQQFEANCTAAGGHVHWAADAAQARSIVLNLLAQQAAREVIKIKSMTTAEIDLNAALQAAGISAFETDLAELILQLGGQEPSHIVVPALHVNRSQIREIFAQRMNQPHLGQDPKDLAEAARLYLRQKFLSITVAIGGANYLVADTGSVVIVESEGNGRMCLTLPNTLIAIAGIDKILPRHQDLEVLLQVLARSATGERMNPYNSIWTGITPGDGPQNFHVILLDNGRSPILARPVLRQTLQCIRCAACLNTCPVYRQTGGHAYGSVYSGPIGAILTPQLERLRHAQSLPYASSLCGACYEVCPVKINIPEVLIELRSQVVDQQRRRPASYVDPMFLGMKLAKTVFRSARRLQAAQRLARIALAPFTGKSGWIARLPGLGSRWTITRDLRGLPQQTFREWWRERENLTTTLSQSAQQSAEELGWEDFASGHDFSHAGKANGINGNLAPEGRFSAALAQFPGFSAADSNPNRTRTPIPSTSESRDPILDRIRAATGETQADSQAVTQQAAHQVWTELPREYDKTGSLTTQQTLALLIERLREYDAEVVTTTPARLADTLAQRILAQRTLAQRILAQTRPASGRTRFVLPPAIPHLWPEAIQAATQATTKSQDPAQKPIEWLIDGPGNDPQSQLAPAQLTPALVETAHGVLTAATCAVADSGTIVLHHGPTEGRRLLTLLPDYHLCVLHSSQVVATLPEYFARFPQPPRLATWFSGPSATADIEMTRIKGVHGPRFLEVILVLE